MRDFPMRFELIVPILTRGNALDCIERLKTQNALKIWRINEPLQGHSLLNI